MTNRVMGMGSMLGFSIGAMKEQFKNPSSGNDNSGDGLKGLVSRAKSIINPNMNLSAEKDYSGNINPIRNVINNQNRTETNNENKVATNKIANRVMKTGYNATKAYLRAGANLVEGKFDNNLYKDNINRKNEFQNADIINRVAENRTDIKKVGDENENQRNG